KYRKNPPGLFRFRTVFLGGERRERSLDKKYTKECSFLSEKGHIKALKRTPFRDIGRGSQRSVNRGNEIQSPLPRPRTRRTLGSPHRVKLRTCLLGFHRKPSLSWKIPALPLGRSLPWARVGVI